MKNASADKEMPSQRPTSDLSASKGPSPVRDLTRMVLALLARQQIRSLTQTETLTVCSPAPPWNITSCS